MVAEAIRQHAPNAVLVVFETGSLSTWFHHELTAAGLPAVCIDARHAKAALDARAHRGMRDIAAAVGLHRAGRGPAALQRRHAHPQGQLATRAFAASISPWIASIV
mgnify:CR=1 FL=1